VAGVVLHTDQGGEFSGGALARVCTAAGIVQSMGRTGSALDNAVAESFHSTLTFELRSRHRFATREQARRAVVAWLQEYNTDRLHSTNAMISPVDYENSVRRPDAKAYDQLRRRRRGKQDHQKEAASPLLTEPFHGCSSSQDQENSNYKIEVSTVPGDGQGRRHERVCSGRPFPTPVDRVLVRLSSIAEA
jgi:hypothetical protein